MLLNLNILKIISNEEPPYLFSEVCCSMAPGKQNSVSSGISTHNQKQLPAAFPTDFKLAKTN